jgi:hypothetical protein
MYCVFDIGVLDFLFSLFDIAAAGEERTSSRAGRPQPGTEMSG